MRKTDLKFQGEGGLSGDGDWVGGGVGKFLISEKFPENSEKILGNFLKITGWSGN